jgi:hypothetical protein
VAEEEPLKSAFELAMERLRSKDAAEGIEEAKPLSDDQKRRIAEARKDGEAKLAELQILHRKDRIEAGGDPEKLAELERKHRIDNERIESKVESAIAKIRAES